MKLSWRPLVFLFVLTLVCVAAFADEFPLKDWTPVPWSPAPAGRLTALASSAAFMPMAPCRVYDSRSATMLTGGTARTVNVDGGPCAGIPAGALAYSVNITAFGSTATSSYAFITAYATGTTRPTVSTLNYLTGTQVANAAVVPAGTGNDIDIYSSATTHFIVDINGYYATTQNAGDGFFSVSGTNVGVYGASTSNWGVYGLSGTTYGVVGISSGSSSVAGVAGSSSNGKGVYGISTNLNGVWAESTNQDGLFASGGRDGAYIQGARHGVIGTSTAASTTAVLYGVSGSTTTTGSDSAGVMGSHHASWAQTMNCGGCVDGVRGIANATGKYNIGVDGEGTSVGVLGQRVTATGVQVTWGALGYDATEGVYTANHLTASGGKSFVEPHPTQAGKIIRYESLEGPEHGTYFRGRGRMEGRIAVISVPETFSLVTSADDLSIQVTPIGDLAQIAVTYIGLDRIELKSNRDVEFFYTVNGIRNGVPQSRTIDDDISYFVPRSADDVLSRHSSYPEMQRRLIDTGVYNEDGSVNMQTAEKFGWAQQWRETAAAAANQQQ